MNTVKTIVPIDLEGLKALSEKGKENLLKAFNIIGDRTDFKGQSMLKYRVASEDPMCHNRGNFYHYHWQ